MRVERSWVLSLLLLVVPLACGETTPDAALRAKVAEGCAINTDCAAPLVCAFRTCHIECQTSRDCASNGPTSKCVQGEKPFRVCQNEKEQKCVRHSQCPGDQVCGVDGQCRDACADDRDCGTTQKCVATTCVEPAELGPDGKLTPKTETGAFVSCARSSECPGALVCLDNACKEECLGDKDCPVGARCEATRCVIGSVGQGGRGGSGGTGGAGGSGGQAGAITSGGRAGDGGGATAGVGGGAGVGGVGASGAGGGGGDIVKGGDGGTGGVVDSGGNGGDPGSGGTKLEEGGNGGESGTGATKGGESGSGGTEAGESGSGGTKVDNGGHAGDDGSGGTKPGGGGSAAGGNGGSGPTTTCACLDPNDECDASLRCVKKGVACTPITNCGTGYACGADNLCRCTDDKICGRGCRGGADCPEGLVCNAATERCGPPRTPLRCLGNASCGPGEGCLGDTCKPLGNKPAGETCANHQECSTGVCSGVCLATCDAESDCPNGLRCGPAASLPGGAGVHTSTLVCVAQPPCGCGAGEVCTPNFRCEAFPCGTTADCASDSCYVDGYNSGRCYPIGSVGRCAPSELVITPGVCILPKVCYLDDPTGCPSGYACTEADLGGAFASTPDQGVCARKP